MNRIFVMLAPFVFIALCIFAAIALVVYRRLRLRRLLKAARGNPAEAMATLRLRVLTGTAQQWTQRTDIPLWGCVMEMRRPGGVATLVALDDGSTSLYTSTGGGVLGGKSFPQVAAAAQAVCQLATRLVEHAVATSEFPHPPADHIRFYLLTPQGTRVAECNEAALASGSHPLSPLFVAGHQLLAELRQASGNRFEPPSPGA